MTTKPDKSHPARFTGSIDIAQLERESRKLLYAGFLVGILIQGIIGAFIPYRRVEIKTAQDYRTMTVRLIDRPSMLTEPYEISGRQFSPKPLERMTTNREKVQGSISSRLLSPGEADDPIDTGDLKYEPEIYAEADTGSIVTKGFSFDDGIKHVPDRHISLTDEWISIDGLDIGQFKALIIHDPNDKTNIKGYVHIPVSIWGTTMKPASETRSAIANLGEGLFRYTGIKVTIDKAVYLTSSNLNKYPFIYITADDLFDITESEAEIFRKYLDN